MIRKLQTALVALWALVVLLVMAFNWTLVWQDEAVEVLFVPISKSHQIRKC